MRGRPPCAEASLDREAGDDSASPSGRLESESKRALYINLIDLGDCPEATLQIRPFEIQRSPHQVTAEFCQREETRASTGLLLGEPDLVTVQDVEKGRVVTGEDELSPVGIGLGDPGTARGAVPRAAGASSRRSRRTKEPGLLGVPRVPVPEAGTTSASPRTPRLGPNATGSSSTWWTNRNRPRGPPRLCSSLSMVSTSSIPSSAKRSNSKSRLRGSRERRVAVTRCHSHLQRTGAPTGYALNRGTEESHRWLSPRAPIPAIARPAAPMTGSPRRMAADRARVVGVSRS